MVPGFWKEETMGENSTCPFRIMFTLLQGAKLHADFKALQGRRSISIPE